MLELPPPNVRYGVVAVIAVEHVVVAAPAFDRVVSGPALEFVVTARAHERGGNRNAFI